MLHKSSRSELKLLKKQFAIRKGLNRFCISSVVLAERIDFSVLCTFQFLLQKILRVKRMLMEGIQIRTTAASLFTVSMAFLNESFVLLVWCLTERWSCATGLRKFVAKVSLSRSMTLGSSHLILSKFPIDFSKSYEASNVRQGIYISLLLKRHYPEHDFEKLKPKRHMFIDENLEIIVKFY